MEISNKSHNPHIGFRVDPSRELVSGSESIQTCARTIHESGSSNRFYVEMGKSLKGRVSTKLPDQATNQAMNSIAKRAFRHQ